MQSETKSTIAPLPAFFAEFGARLPWPARWSFLCLPARCYFCDSEGDLGPVDLCAACLATLPWVAAARSDEPTLCALVYREPIDEALKALKYQSDRRAARLFGALLAAAAQQREIPDVLIPVPLHDERVRTRGYNQSWLIAQHVGYWLQRRVQPHWITRVRDTPSQTGLHAAERRLNVAGAFVARPDLHGEADGFRHRRVAVVDDVTTTGATFEAVTEALRAAGVVDVQRWAVAKAMPTNSTSPT